MKNVTNFTHKIGSWFLLGKPIELVPLWGEKYYKLYPQNRILLPLDLGKSTELVLLWGEKYYKLHPQNRILVSLWKVNRVGTSMG